MSKRKEKTLGVKGKRLFIDSGAHGLYSKFVIERNHREGYEFYRGEEFWRYVDSYAEFIKHRRFPVFANVDVIFRPAMTYRVQRYLEKRHGIRPIPVFHYGTPMKWLDRYLKEGHEYIALGGLGQEVNREQYTNWADEVFDRLCDTPDRLPICKVHGFAITSFSLMQRYPWYSVDSTSWLLHASRGVILVPRRKRNGEWVFDADPYLISIAYRKRNPKSHLRGEHLLKPTLRRLVESYIREMGFEYGESKTEYDPKTNTMHEIIISKGVANDHYMRGALNALYYIQFARSLRWPRPFVKPERKMGNLGLI